MAIGRVRAVLGLHPEKPLLFISECKAIYTGMSGHPSIFIAPNPVFPTLLTQIQDVESCQQLVITGVKGAVEARTVKIGIVRSSLENERMYVQNLCDASPSQAASIITAAAMKVASFGGYHKDLLTAKNGPTGTILLFANVKLLDATNRARFYNWSYTLDGKSFIIAPPTPGPETSIGNLAPLTIVGFRVAVTVGKDPQGPWSEVVNIVVR